MILIVGEKPSVSRAISSVVGASTTKKGYTEGNGYIVSWCVGHLVGLKYPNDYGNGWEQKWSFSQLPMIPEKWLFKVTDSTKAQYNIIKDLMNRGDVTEIICATDADREGECIFRYVYIMARGRKPVKRLWVSSLEESAIRKALTNMKPMSDYDSLFDAGYARARADWLIGMKGSRLFSVRYGGKLNIGRVQTPTLAMIVQRDAEVGGFVKQKYFTADLNCGDFILSSARIDDESATDSLVSACDGKTVTISSVKREVKTEKAPKLYDLTTLQREANKAFGYTAQQTLDYTQSLYEGKLVTYPRTDSQYLSDDMAQTAFDVLWLCDRQFGFGISHTPDISKVINNSKVSGHHAIIPTKLTAEWESKLQQIEHGRLPEAVFMSGIQQFVAEMCRKCSSEDKSVTLSDSHEPAGKCPKCGAEVVKGKFGYYCKSKCGMNIAKVYGVELSDTQVKALLGDKPTSYTSKGKKTIVRPEIVENPYNGKMYYQWKTERGK